MLQILYFTIVIDAIMSVKLVTTIIPNIAQVEGSIVEKKNRNRIAPSKIHQSEWMFIWPNFPLYSFSSLTQADMTLGEEPTEESGCRKKGEPISDINTVGHLICFYSKQ